jgi:hypothetical protein
MNTRNYGDRPHSCATLIGCSPHSCAALIGCSPHSCANTKPHSCATRLPTLHTSHARYTPCTLVDTYYKGRVDREIAMFTYYEPYQVLLRREHRCAVYGLDKHLKQQHGNVHGHRTRGNTKTMTQLQWIVSPLPPGQIACSLQRWLTGSMRQSCSIYIYLEG